MHVSRKNYLWIPSVYMMQGLPFALVAVFSPVFYKEFDVSNRQIAFYTSLFILPWILKFFFSPALEQLATKKYLAILLQIIMAGLVLLLAFTLFFPNTIYLSGALFLLIAISSALHDIVVDGLYLEYLDFHAQAKYIGIRSIFYQLGKLLCQGLTLYGVGLFALYFTKETLWFLAYCWIAGIIFLFAWYNYKFIPKLHTVNPLQEKLNFKMMWSSYRNVFNEFCQLPHLSTAIVFLLFYNTADAQLIKILPLYMLDSVQQGGLGMNVADVGIIYGIVSLLMMLAGIGLSGFLLNRTGLKKCLLPFTFLLALGNASFLWLAVQSFPSVWQVSVCVALTQFFFGLCNGAYMFYIIRLFGNGTYAMSLYAIATAIMLLGFMLTGAVAGYIQYFLGYTGFFVWLVCISLCLIALAAYQVEKVL